MPGRAVDEYRAPLFLAWQLTNRCGARCITCCEESGPDRHGADELTRAEALDLARRIVAFGIPYVAFGGGEPLGVPHCWELFEILAAGGVALKIETDGPHIDDAAADRLAALAVQCVQVSVDGATAATHERVRPGSSFDAATAAIRRLAARGLAPQLVFVPTRLNLHEVGRDLRPGGRAGLQRFRHRAADAARARGGGLGHASPAARRSGQARSLALRERERVARDARPRFRSIPGTSSPRLEQRLESPQAMLLVVPNGKVKLLNALPFAPADLRRDSLEQAWQAYREAWQSSEVSRVRHRLPARPGLAQARERNVAARREEQELSCALPVPRIAFGTECGDATRLRASCAQAWPREDDESAVSYWSFSMNRKRISILPWVANPDQPFSCATPFFNAAAAAAMDAEVEIYFTSRSVRLLGERRRRWPAVRASRAPDGLRVHAAGCGARRPLLRLQPGNGGVWRGARRPGRGDERGGRRSNVHGPLHG